MYENPDKNYFGGKMIRSFFFKSALPVFLQALGYRMRALLGYFYVPKMNRLQGEDMFFIVGCGRSGNTLLRSMLVCGGQVCIPPESYVLPRAIAVYKAYGFLPWSQLASLVVSEFEAFPEFSTWRTDLSVVHLKARSLPKHQQNFEDIVRLVYEAYRDQHFSAAIRLGDKTPVNTIFLSRISAVYPKARYVHILRDPRACVASYMRSDMRGVNEAIDFWLTATRNCLRLERALPASQFLRIEYESLVCQPKLVLEAVCSLLDVNYSELMLDFWKNPVTLGDVDAHAHHANTRNPLNQKSIDSWREVMTSEDVFLVEQKCMPLYRELTKR